MSRTRRYALQTPPEKLAVSLFPFLSIFLCVMGVLSFINVLSSFSTPQKIELTAKLETGYKVAYQIFSLPDGIISVPPVSHLAKLRDAVSNPDDKVFIDTIISDRKTMIDTLKAHTGSVMNAATSPDIENILETLHTIKKLNELALKTNVLYEEFLLFGIYPNGGQAYQKIRDIMAFTPDAQSISVGLEPLDSNWTLNLNK